MHPPAHHPDGATTSRPLTTKIGFLPAFAANVLNMVGVGPFLTIPLVLGAMGGPQAMLGWAAGALLALCDGLVWAEFGASIPTSGGSYNYLREAFGPNTWGRLMSFLFLAQTVVAAPLTAASGGVGFAEYAAFLFPSLSYWQGRSIAVGVCLFATLLLYRNIRDIGRISIILTGLLLFTMGWIVIAGAMHFDTAKALAFPPHAFQPTSSFFFGLGAATLIAMYDYSGYFNVCLIGGEIANPAKVIPRCVVTSICFLGVCYAAMSFAMLGVLPWQRAVQSRAIVSEFALQISGPTAARWLTILILIAAFGSVYTVLLGFSRVPFAAAVEGHFFSIFARVHKTKGFPSFSVVALGLASALACLLSLDSIIKSLLVIQIMTQFIAQCIGLLRIRRARPEIARPFRMPLYPLPLVVALIGWTFILLSSGPTFIAAGTLALISAVILFLLWSRVRSEWPYGKTAND